MESATTPTLAIVFVVIYFGILAGLMLVAGIMYILNGIGYIKIAKKVGVEKGWLGFVPVAIYYLLGKFAEKDNEIHHPNGKQIKWSKVLLTSSIVFSVLDLAVCAFFTVMGVIAGMASTSEEGAVFSIGVSIVAILFSALIILVAIAFSVLQYIAFYKVLHLMAPKHAWWILLVAILVAPIAYNIAILIFAFSKQFPTYLSTPTAPAASTTNA